MWMMVSLALAGDVALVEQGATWSYWDTGVEAPGWTTVGFDDSAWPTGPAPLGYGDSHIVTTVSFGGDSSNKHITSWYRTHFDVSQVQSAPLNLSIMRDDGARVFLNGVEVVRSNLPGGVLTPSTRASGGASPEQAWHDFSIDPALLVVGDNVLAVEVHQVGPTSSDTSLDVELAWDVPGVSRGPYLQLPTADSIRVRWRTNVPLPTQLLVGEAGATLDQQYDDVAPKTEHEVLVTGLQPGTTYEYAVRDGSLTLAGGADHTFKTKPGPGEPIRVWVLGDSGTANANARAVRDAFEGWRGTRDADAILMLGDNAYNSGTDAEYQAAVFETYPVQIRRLPLWSTLGNHDGYSADSASQTGPYYEIFNLPTQGESGGEPSGTEAYYSFDMGDVHFVCLDSYESGRSRNGAMLSWLVDDLARTDATWTVAFWHHPPYTKGSHDSDIEGQLIDMRENALPILESYGVDLVLSGHSHAYERSRLIDGHYAYSWTLTSAMVLDDGDGDQAGDGAYRKPTTGAGPHEGALYVVAGSSGKISGGTFDHPVMEASLQELGSLVLDVDGHTLSGTFLDDVGQVRDRFQIRKGVELVVGRVEPGGRTRVSAIGARPGESVLFGVSSSEGAGPCPPSLDGQCLGLLRPQLVGTVVADTTGLATFEVDVPARLGGATEMFVQAAVLGTSQTQAELSDVVGAPVSGPICPPGGVAVCAWNGTTWTSSCEATAAGWPIRHDGVCP